MPTALLAWELGGGVGHCVNLAPIASGLLERGWDVWVAARDMTTAEIVLRPANVSYLQAPMLVANPVRPKNPTRTFAHILHNVGFGDDRQLDVLVAGWCHLFDFICPDVLVCEHAPTALLASRRYDIRRIILGTGFFSPPDVSPLPELRYWRPSDPSENQVDEAAVLFRVNQWLTRHRLSSLERLSQLYSSADANFLLTFAELDHYPQRQANRYWGMWSLSRPLLPEWPDGPGSRVFAYLKPLPSRSAMSVLLATLRETRLPTLVYVAGGSPEWLRRFQSPRLRFLTQPVDIHEVGRRCDLAILNGNAGTATELLLRGVPQLHIPLFLEQEVFSQRVVELGAALIASPNRPEQIVARLMSLVHSRDRYAEAAHRFAAAHMSYQSQASINEIVARIDSGNT